MKTMKHISLYLLTAAVVIITAALSAFAAETDHYSVSSPDGSVIFDMEMGKSSVSLFHTIYLLCSMSEKSQRIYFRIQD